MFKRIFGSKKKVENLVSPLSGKVMSLSEVPDPVFSEKMMGDGIAVFPEVGEVVSPVDGEIIQVFPTKHAVGIRSAQGVEILIHIGLETVSLNGEGFTAHVKEGDAVKVGQRLITFDKAFLEANAPSIVVPIVITNQDKVKNMSQVGSETVEMGKDVLLELEVQ